jgi:hypothetical protein
MWPNQWSMAASGYVYCYLQCPMPWLLNNTQYGNFSGVLGIDHVFTGQGMPCIDGVPHEFEAQDAYTLQVKKVFPSARVLQYRITDAVPYASIVHDLMVSNPEYFVRWPNGTICQMPFVEEGTTNQGCAWDIRAAAYDWTQQDVRDWYVENIIKSTMNVGQGAWIDGDGPTNGAWMCSGSYDWGNLPTPYPALNETGVAAFCAGEGQVVQAANEWLISNGGYQYECFDYVTSSSVLPNVNDTATSCAAKLKALDHLPTSTAIVLYGDRTNNKVYSDGVDTAQAVAVFLLVRGEQWFFGLPTANAWNTTTAPLLLSDFGAPLGNMSSLAGQPYVFQRQYEKALVELDCGSYTAKFTPT